MTTPTAAELTEQIIAAIDYAHACAEHANNEMHPDKCWGSCQCGRQERLEQIEAAKNALTAQSAEIERLRAALEFYAELHNWKNDDGEYSDDSIAYDDKGQRARSALTPPTPAGEQR